jgi:hypothetical protein
MRRPSGLKTFREFPLSWDGEREREGERFGGGIEEKRKKKFHQNFPFFFLPSPPPLSPSSSSPSPSQFNGYKWKVLYL